MNKEKESIQTYFYCRSKTGADAKGYISENGFTVCAGSRIAEKCSSKTFMNTYSKTLDKLIANKIIVDFVFEKDYTFGSPTAEADVVLQSYVSGTEYWLDSNNKKLKKYNL